MTSEKNTTEGLFVVRLWDGMDGLWMDVSEHVSREEAERIWLEKTANGTKNISFDEIDYYSVYPADTVMRFSEENRYSMREGRY